MMGEESMLTRPHAVVNARDSRRAMATDGEDYLV
jgi:hypothetical protein